MASLALAAALVTLSILGLGLVAAGLSLAGWRTAGGVVGLLAVTSGLWLAVTLPHAVLLWVVPLAAGAWAVGRWAWR